MVADWHSTSKLAAIRAGDWLLKFLAVNALVAIWR
jgi:hypothetical protein